MRTGSFAEDERKRLLMACDVHDYCVQAIVAADLKLQALKRQLAPEAGVLIEETQELVRDASQRLRGLLFEFSPIQPGASLEEAIQGYVDRAMEGIFCAPVKRSDICVPEDVAILAYRIAQEALTNVRRHSGATAIHVEMRRENDGLLLEIADNGRGFAGTWSRPGHFGLASMRRRAEEAGGWLAIDSSPGIGTTITFWLGIPDSRFLPCV